MNKKTKEASMSVKENKRILGLNQMSRAELRWCNPRASHVVEKTRKVELSFRSLTFAIWQIIT